ncbi:MAG: hypothetical protein V3T86_14380 [Planctomycetota bacterium]
MRDSVVVVFILLAAASASGESKELRLRIDRHIKRLSHTDPAVRDTSYVSLLRIGEPALEQVRKARNSADPGTRRASSKLMRTLRVPALLRALRSPDRKTRHDAKWQLYELGPENLRNVERHAETVPIGPARANLDHLLLLLRTTSEASANPRKGACHASVYLEIEYGEALADVVVVTDVKSDRFVEYRLEVGKERDGALSWRHVRSTTLSGRATGHPIGDRVSLAGRARPGDLVRVRFGFGKSEAGPIRRGVIHAVVPGKRGPEPRRPPLPAIKRLKIGQFIPLK